MFGSSLLPALVLLSAQPAPAPAPEATPQSAAATPATASSTTAGLRVGITQYDGASVSDAMTQRIRTMGEEVYRQNGVTHGDESSPVIVEITVGPHGEEGYASNIVVRKHQQEVVGARRDNIVCELCTESELIAQLQDNLQEIMPAVQQAATEDDSLSEPPPVVEGPEPGPEQPTTEPTKPGLSNLAKAGIATFVVGALTVGIGAGVFVSGTQSGGDNSTPGAIVTGIGAALSVTGAALLIVDQSRANKRRRTAFAPIYDGRTAGVSLAGRF